MKTVLVVLCALGVLLLASPGCNSDAAATVRPYTYGREFRYYDPRDIENSMHRMARAVQQLDALLKAEQPVTAEQQAEVVALLEQVERAAVDLRTAGAPSNHPRLGANLEGFIRTVHSARESAARTPPNYFLAGSITGECLHCHSAPRP